MNKSFTLKLGLIYYLFFFSIQSEIYSQTILTGTLKDAKTGEALIGASVIVKGTTIGTSTDFDGDFIIKYDGNLPVNLECRYSGYTTFTMAYSEPNTKILIKMEEESVLIDVVEVKGQRISDKQKSSPLTVESMDLLAIKETPSANFYDGLGALKDVDLTTASLGFTIINTRGFNSTSPVRSLQIIDGVDNQSPGLNFSLGNFLGACELDVNKVDLIVGASSAFYGPNAFNGVINIETKNPFIHKGLTVQFKTGERSLLENSIRWANALKNKNGNDFLAYKFNFCYLKAYDWEANNTEAVYNTISSKDNPGGYDAVNTYGDEYQSIFDFRNVSPTFPGLNVFHRKGYQEKDLVDYNSYNFKSNVALHLRLSPKKTFNSPELIFSSSYGGGTTVYQGDNRFSLKNIKFYQHRIEVTKLEKYFLRIYGTHEHSGDSYDPYFTALKLQEASSNNIDWKTQYSNYWVINIAPKIKAIEGYPKLSNFPGMPDKFNEALANFLLKLNDSLFLWHGITQDTTNSIRNPIFGINPYYEPDSPEFKDKFNDITSRIAFSEGGTKFYDRSALIHSHGEYKFNDLISNRFINDLNITIGSNFRIYYPDSKGSILLDTGASKINTYEWGFYTGSNLRFFQNTLKVNVTARLDKHENFNYLFSPAASIVYQPTNKDFLRLSFSSAIRNPTLTDQYLHYNVGRATLLGNINGIENLITVESFVDYLNSFHYDTLSYFDVAPIRPEKVKTMEFGYRTTLFNSIYIDLGYYFSRYKDFIGYQLGIQAKIDRGTTIPSDIKAYRVSANAQDEVTTQGFSIGINYFFNKYFQLKGNYSWNQLNTQTDDPIIPAFNTPEHKYNLGISGRDIRLFGINNFGFNINYKWINGFLFEGSPQFTGFISSYNMTDAQLNWIWKKINTTFKIGASNIFNQKNYQTYGGPLIGRMSYLSITYDFRII